MAKKKVTNAPEADVTEVKDNVPEVAETDVVEQTDDKEGEVEISPDNVQGPETPEGEKVPEKEETPEGEKVPEKEEDEISEKTIEIAELPDYVKRVMQLYSDTPEMYITPQGGVFPADSKPSNKKGAILYKNPFYKS